MQNSFFFSKAIKAIKAQKRSRALRQAGVKAPRFGSLPGGGVNVTLDWGRFMGPDPTPPEMWKDFTICSDMSFTNPASTLMGDQVLTWALNGPFTPKSAGSHQPYGWDQYSGLYASFVVDRVSVQIQASTAATSGQFMAVAIQTPTDAADLTGETIHSVAERNNVRLCQVPANQSCTVDFAIDLHTVLGITRTQYLDDDKYQGLTASANPSLVPVMMIATANTASSANGINGMIRITYHTKLFRRLTQAQS